MFNKIFFYILIISSICFSQEIYDGYTLFTPSTETVTYLMDIDNTIVNSWQHETNNYPASMAYLIEGTLPGLENTILVYPTRCNNVIMDQSVYGGKIIYYNFCIPGFISGM